jgi:hypothetical protein
MKNWGKPRNPNLEKKPSAHMVKNEEIVAEYVDPNGIASIKNLRHAAPSVKAKKFVLINAEKVRVLSVKVAKYAIIKG